METVDKGEKSGRLEEIVWCPHLRLIPSPLISTSVAHAYLPPQKTYIIVEEQKVKLLCPECWRAGIQKPGLFARES